MRFDIDAWDPSYGTAFEAGGDGPQAESSAKVEAGVELPPSAWHAIEAPATVAPPDVVLLVDGVQRIDTRVWVTDDDGLTHLGLAASYAAGVVRCDLRRGVAELADARIERGFFSPRPRTRRRCMARTVRYPAFQVAGASPRICNWACSGTSGLWRWPCPAPSGTAMTCSSSTGPCRSGPTCPGRSAT